MMKILNLDSLSLKIKKAFRSVGVIDFVLEKRGDQILFGVAGDLYSIPSESELIPLLFGPFDYTEQDIFKPETAQALSQILPLPLWVWGWDSV